jgi:hypothetical protein
MRTTFLSLIRPSRVRNARRPMDFNKEWTQVGPKSVLQPVQTIPLLVRKFYTDVNGTVIDKTTAPAALQIKMPVFFLGDFDRMGAYRTALQVVPPVAGCFFLQSFINGSGATVFDIVGVNPFSDIQTQLNPGDMVNVFTDSLTAPNYYVWTVIGGTYASMASIIGNTSSSQQDGRLGQLNVDYINLYVDSTTLQLYQPLNFTRLFNTGTFRNDSVNPSMFKTPFNKLRNLVTLDTQFIIDQYIGINFYMGYDTDTVQMDLILKTLR